MTGSSATKTYTPQRKRGRKPRGEAPLSPAEDDSPAGGPITVILSEPDVLDCQICYDPLTTPVYQCEKGHVACSNCRTKINNTCPSCAGKIGDMRCLAMEKVVETVKVQCPYKSHGCTESVSYCNKSSHEETCMYAPYPCPFKGCEFRGLPRGLSLHLSDKHKNSVVSFKFDTVFSFILKPDQETFRVLREERDGTLFMLMCSENSALQIRCSGESVPGETRFAYAIMVKRGNSAIRFQSFTEKAYGMQSDAPAADFVKVPGYLRNLAGWIKVEACIWKGASHADISGAINGAS